MEDQQENATYLKRLGPRARVDRIEKSLAVFGDKAVDMLTRVHEDALWILENLGVGCKQPEMQETFRKYEQEGLVVMYENRIYITKDLVEIALSTIPGVDDFFVPLDSLFIGGTAPYLYDDKKGEGGIMPTDQSVEKIARFAESSPVVAGMGRGVKLPDEARQMEILAKNCSKPLYVAVTNAKALEKAQQIYKERGNIMIVFCLTRPPLEVNENFSDSFVDVVKAGLPVFVSAMPMAGISAPFCYNGVLAMTHAEVLFGLTLTQLMNPGNICIHAGFPTIADPRIEYNPHYGLISHNLLNIMMAHLNLMLDIPSCQSGGTTHEEHPTDRAYKDARMGHAMIKKYGVHMMRHPFSFLRYLIDFSMEKMEKAAQIFPQVSPDEAPFVEMPAYDERGMDSIRNIGLRSYMDDPLTTANFGKVFVS